MNAIVLRKCPSLPAIVALVFGLGLGATVSAEPPAPERDHPADWDQVANIKSAAKRIALVQRRKGAKAALELISNCYKTHSLSEKYSRGFETCLAQDYMETRTLVEIYSRLKPDVLAKLGAPSPKLLAQSMGRRIATGFSKYKVPVAYAETFKSLVDKHGWPVFIKIVFPKANIENKDGVSPKR